MPLAPILLILWPLALIGLTLVGSAILTRLPDRCEDLWQMPRATPSRPGAFR